LGNMKDEFEIKITFDADTAEFAMDYLGNRLKDSESIKNHLLNKNYECIKVLGHKMRGSGGLYGFEGITGIGNELEKASLINNHSVIEQLNDSLCEYIKKAREYLSKNMHNHLNAQVNEDEEHISRSPLPTKGILIADDDQEILIVLENQLLKAGYRVFKADNGRKALELAETLIPDLAVFDINMPGLNGLQVMEKLNESTATADVPVIFLTAKNTVREKVEGLDLGAYDYITKPYNKEELLARVGAALRKSEKDKLSDVDFMTGLYNKRYFEKQFQQFSEIGRRYGEIFSLAVVDLDGLKSINDIYGHVAGDLAIKKLSITMKQAFRHADIICRYGGDEFVVILPKTDEPGAEGLRKRLQHLSTKILFINDKNGNEIKLSASIGISTYRKGLNTALMFEIADRNMYADKKQRYLKKTNSIVIIDDDADIAKILIRILKEKDYDVIWENDGRLGLEKIKEIIPGLVILDIMLPKLNGYQVLEILKQTDSVKHIPVLMLSGKKGKDIVKGLSEGAVEYITKPFNPKELIIRIEKILGRTSIPD